MRLFAVLGLGQFGLHVAKTLNEKGGDVLALDREEERVEKAKDWVASAACLDVTNGEALKAVGAAEAEVAVVALGERNLEANILATAHLRDQGVGSIICRAQNQLQGRILMRVGAARVVYPEKEMGIMLAKEILAPDVLDRVPLTTGHSLAEVRPAPSLVGHSLKNLDFRKRFSINVVAIQRQVPFVDDQGERQHRVEVANLAGPDDVIDRDDILVVVGPDESIEALSQMQ